jgi:Flp pilus assembly protein TadG
MMPVSKGSPTDSRLLRRFRRNRRGSAAVEFALVAPLFFALLFAIIESALVFFAGQVLETGTQDAARAFLTSQVQSNGTNATDFKQSICDKVSALFACSDVYVDVRSYPKGSAITITDPIDSDGKFTNNFVYEPPPVNSENTVVVRAYYQWPIYVTQLGYNIANINKNSSNGKRLLAATAALRPQ